MCQAIVKPKDAIIYRATLETAWKSNPHGGGYAWIDPDDEQIRIRKGYTSFDDFWNDFKEHMERDCLVHFRWATHGDKGRDNMHPFIVAPGVVMVHNGVLSDFLPSTNDSRSDTRIFAGRLATWIKKAGGWKEFMKPGVDMLLEEMIGGNKLAFLDANGFTIINEGLGEWADGTWYSAGKPKHYQQHYTPRTAENWESMADHFAEGAEPWQYYGHQPAIFQSRGEAAAVETHRRLLQQHEEKSKKEDEKSKDFQKVTEEERQRLIDQNYITWIGKDNLRHRRHYVFMTVNDWEEMETDQLSRKGGPMLVEDPTTGDVIFMEEDDVPLATENEGDIAEEIIQYMTPGEVQEFRELIKDPSIEHTVRDRLLKRLKRGNRRGNYARNAQTAIIRVLDSRSSASTITDSVEAAMGNENREESTNVTPTSDSTGSRTPAEVNNDGDE